ncbi:MAG: hypothetical protein PHQ03_12045 [Methylococcales bacterium]|nr:hypothetical protein [Methylococcales bacterium]
MNELKIIAEINEEIKKIIDLAEDISLTATNAILIARQAGSNAVGFSVVARELRMFSDKIATAMQELSQLIYQQVSITATKRNRLRSVLKLNQASARHELAQTRLASACVRSQSEVDEMERVISNILKSLQIAMKRTVKQCASGMVIARSAGIESAHGGEMTIALRQVAQSVENVVNNIAIRIKKLGIQLTEVTA